MSLEAIEPQKAQLMMTDRLSLHGLQALLLEEYGASHCVMASGNGRRVLVTPVQLVMCCLDWCAVHVW